MGSVKARARVIWTVLALAILGCPAGNTPDVKASDKPSPKTSKTSKPSTKPTGTPAPKVTPVTLETPGPTGSASPSASPSATPTPNGFGTSAPTTPVPSSSSSASPSPIVTASPTLGPSADPGQTAKALAFPYVAGASWTYTQKTSANSLLGTIDIPGSLNVKVLEILPSGDAKLEVTSVLILSGLKLPVGTPPPDPPPKKQEVTIKKTGGGDFFLQLDDAILNSTGSVMSNEVATLTKVTSGGQTFDPVVLRTSSVVSGADKRDVKHWCAEGKGLVKEEITARTVPKGFKDQLPSTAAGLVSAPVVITLDLNGFNVGTPPPASPSTAPSASASP